MNSSKYVFVEVTDFLFLVASLI